MRRCVGGFLDGSSVFTDEDVHQCHLGGGTVLRTSEPNPACAASSISGMGSAAMLPGIADTLKPLRRLRERSTDHPMVKALLSLNAAGAKEIERIATSDHVAMLGVVTALSSLSKMAQAVTGRGEGTYDERTHASFTELGKSIAERSADPVLKSGIDQALRLAAPFIGKSYQAIGQEIMKPEPVRPPRAPDGPNVHVLITRFPSATVIEPPHFNLATRSVTDWVRMGEISLEVFRKLTAADQAIQAKIHALGDWVGDAQGDVEIVPGGCRRVYAYADIYVGENGVAFEVHGDIRAKYDYLKGPFGPLGLPITDETGTPDGKGRYNHFQHGGSIYWSPSTGPMGVRSTARNLWASQGWELGLLGYPVADYYKLPGMRPADNPNLAWVLFENGAIFSQGNAVAVAMAADIDHETLKNMIRTFFDKRLHAANNDLGLEAPVDLVAVSDWSYGFEQAVPRTITYRLYGFLSRPISDPTFEIEIRLRFGTTWPITSHYPTHMSLIVALDWLKVRATVAELSQGVHNGILGAFFRGKPDPEHPELPDGAIFLESIPTGVSQIGLGDLNVINMLTTAQGGLQILLNPLPPSAGEFRRMVAQSQVDDFVQSF